MSRKKVNGIYRIFISVFMAVGTVLIAAGLIWLFSCIRFAKTAVEIPGIISEISRHRDSDGDYHYNVDVSYQYEGKSYENIPVNSYSNKDSKNALQ